LSLLHSTQTGRGQKTQEPQSRHFCIMSLPALAPSQNGWLTGVISGNGFKISSVFSAMVKNLSCSPPHCLRHWFNRSKVQPALRADSMSDLRIFHLSVALYQGGYNRSRSSNRKTVLSDIIESFEL
jgi:hypothetical protein